MPGPKHSLSKSSISSFGGPDGILANFRNISPRASQPGRLGTGSRRFRWLS
jgi:hypothetical protein